jgi:hypothetical protein
MHVGLRLEGNCCEQADRVAAKSQIAKIERMIQGLREQIDQLASRPDKIASQIDCQVQVSPEIRETPPFKYYRDYRVKYPIREPSISE